MGIAWNTTSDKLEFDLQNFGKLEEGNKVVKRAILSSLAKLFDPLGIVSPLMVNAKVLFQELCLQKLDWDEELLCEQKRKWENLVNDFQSVGTISFPRCLYDSALGNVRNCTLHGFADESKRAYCATIYLVYETDKDIFSSLICTKTRVAPLKELSIPRLELMSAKILATLMNVVYQALSPQVTIKERRYWLDSKTALFWIKNSGHWKQFVQHRVDEILKLSNKANWGHCVGICNPADLGSRGVSASTLKESQIWRHGPHWLLLDRKHWPSGLLLENNDDVAAEKRKTATVMTALEEKKSGVSEVIDINRFSSYNRLLRVTAWVFRFISNLKAKREGKNISVNELDASEIYYAETRWIIEAQENLKKDTHYKQLALNLGIYEEEEILKCKGRLRNSDLETESRFPIILPREHKLTELIIVDCHKRVYHNGLKTTLAELRARFWVPQGRQQVKKIVRKSVRCKHIQGRPYTSAPVGDLPAFRVQEAPPFTNVGIDFAGPLFYKTEQGEMKKCYIILYVCCTSRALRLDLVEDLTGQTFIRSLRRYIARRGTPAIINTDNAKTFKFTSKFLEKLARDDGLLSFLTAKRMKWRFNLERSPWWGGYFERMLGSVKRCLKKVLGNAKLNFDELLTIITEIESTLNNRPLTYIYDEIGHHPLTPSHLVYGRRLPQLSEGSEFNSNYFEEDTSSHTKHFLYLVKKLNHFGLVGEVSIL